MKRMLYLSLLLSLLLPFTANTQGLGGLLKKAEQVITGEEALDLSPEEAGSGLKEALDLGIQEAVQLLAKENGYYESVYKILLPEEAQTVIGKLKLVPGFENIEEDLILRINRGAELAVQKAAPIFSQSIQQLTFKDALTILTGEQNAATQYLISTTRDSLYGEFRPVIASSLDEVNARELWSKAVKAYNGIPFVKKVNPELDDHVTNQAMDGLFSLVEKKEVEIRENVGARTSPLLQKVFAQQDD